MNMKKTIAAVAACAMAVSAMATTVSAVADGATEQKAIHYDLTIKQKAKTADLTFVGKKVQTFNHINLYIAKSYKVGANGEKTVNVVKNINTDVTVQVADKSTKTSYTFTFSTSEGSANFDGLAKVGSVEKTLNTGTLADGQTTDVSKKVVATYDKYAIDVTDTSIAGAFDGSTDLDVTVKMTDVVLDDAIDQTALNVALGNIESKFQLDDGNWYPDSAAGYTDISKKITLTNPLIYLTIVDGDDDSSATPANAKGAVKEVDVKQPMKTVSNTKTGTAEIFKRLATKGTKDKDNGYVNVPAVVNDMIANYDDVVFTFNTAADNVFTKASLDANDKQGNWSTNSVKRDYTDYYVTGVPTAESWQGDATYKAFPQALYNLFGDENVVGNVYSDSYVFNNLFNAALVANNNYTMNQSTITPFKYNETSVSFSWSDLTGNVGDYVSPAQAINSLQLATSSDWYWDSMDVTGYTLAADDASTDAGIEDNGSDLDDTEADEDDADIDDGDDADIDADDDADADVDADVDVDTDDADADTDAADDTTADDATATNPATGNAPIALAVIPVALAAAAVVAKKRG